MNSERRYVGQGVCPVCEQLIDHYDSFQFEGEQGYFPWHCDNCGTDGEEWYSLEFCGHNYYDENGEEIILEK